MLMDAPLFSVTNIKFNVIILAAGMGRRLQPETDFIPKALVNVGQARAIDYTIRKFQFVAERMIIASGYCADLLENYVRGRYTAPAMFFSRESVSELCGPGASFLYALDYASCRHPTIVTFCDFIFADQFSVDTDTIVICKPGSAEAVLDTYRTLAVVEEGVVSDIVPNTDPESIRDNGFTGTAICHNTTLLKAIAYSQASSKSTLGDLDYTRDVIRNYVKVIRTLAAPVSSMFEFGTEESLARTRRYLDADY
ncbi:MAG TPA: NTP transferase domain-containing protein [Pirellulales bacterium]|nr:NTP transferase domain-containing protein [Pirellulales bacterium]